jgi:HEAT repeat protein
MDGGSGISRLIQDPEGLLRSALEKIVFFECRVSQLESELSAARAAGDRARSDAASARRREVELEQAAAAEKGLRADVDRRASEAEDRVRLLEAERERLLAGLVDRARIAGAPGSQGAAAEEDGQADLAGFIAELRAEIEALRAFKAAASAAGFGQAAPEPAAGAPAPERKAAASVAELGGRFDAAGRVGVTAGDTARMKELFSTRADRALYERSMEDLDAPDAGRRLRAVHALEALGSRAAAPLLAAALGRERDAEVKAALLAALARLKEPFAADLAERELTDARPAVRIAALEALAAAGGFRGSERLAAALVDESPLVRRRAALLLGFSAGDHAEEALAIALCDPDRGVARAAAAALSGRPSATAQAALARGIEHPDASVRRAAAAALGRLSGESVDVDGTDSARRATSRRIAAKLSAMDGEKLRAAVLETAAAAPVPPPESVRVPVPVPARSPSSPAPAGGEGRGEGVRVARARTAVAVLETPAPAGDPALEQRIVGELRAALRGCTPETLVSVLAVPAGEIDSALAALARRGAAERRGTRWFVS